MPLKIIRKDGQVKLAYSNITRYGALNNTIATYSGVQHIENPSVQRFFQRSDDTLSNVQAAHGYQRFHLPKNERL